MTLIPQPMIALLGFGLNVPEDNLELASTTGRALALNGYAICGGGTQGTMAAALKAAKKAGGKTAVFLDEQSSVPDFCDQVFRFNSQEEKHVAIASACDAAIVIGGGPGSLKLANHFLEAGKKVMVLRNTGSTLENVKFQFDFYHNVANLIGGLKVF